MASTLPLPAPTGPGPGSTLGAGASAERESAEQELGGLLPFLEQYPFPAAVISERYAVDRRESATSVESMQSGPQCAALPGESTTPPAGPDVIWMNDGWRSIHNGLGDGDAARCLWDWVLSGSAAHTFSSGSNTYVLAKTRTADAIVITAVPASPPDSKAGPAAPAIVERLQKEALRRATSLRGRRASTALPTRPLDFRASSRNVSPTVACQRLLDEIDWSQSSIGPRSQWPAALNAIVRIAFSSTTQDAVWAGPDHHLIYNDKYAALVDHPDSFGQSVKIAWEPVWPDLEHLALRCFAGETIHKDNDLLLYLRDDRGRFIEKYHSWSYLPVYDNDRVIAIYNPSNDTTDTVLAARRLQTAQELHEQVRFSRSSAEFFKSVAQVLERNPGEAPFAIVYSVDSMGGKDGHDASLSLAMTVGVPAGHSAAPPRLSVTLDDSTPGFRPHLPTTSYDTTAWPIARVLSTRRSVVVDDCSQIIQGFPVRYWDMLPDRAIVMPLGTDTSEGVPHGVLILGLNLRRPLDTEYTNWLSNVNGGLGHALSSIRALESEAQRREERDQLERAKTRLVQGAAHELRSPLTLIAAPLDDVLQTDLTPQQKRSLHVARRNVRRLQQLVGSLLDFSRIEAGRLQPRFIRADLGQFIEQLAGVFRPTVEGMHLAFNVEIEPSDLPVAFDPPLLECSISNLLTNALKYTEAGSITVTLTYEEVDGQRWANVRVTDTGCGIPAAELSLVTSRFHRATTAVNRGTDGTGIGLPLAKEMIRLHGGDISIESRTAKESGGQHGSVFTARFLTDHSTNDEVPGSVPLGGYGKQLAKEALSFYSEFEGDDEPTTPTEQTRGSGVTPSAVGDWKDALLFERSDKLLVVDDNREIREYVGMIFAPFCTVLEAASAEEALDVARKHKPHLILTDLMMPGMSGHELLLELRRDPQTRLIPIILLTAANDEQAHTAALMAGAEDFMLKPFKSRELVAHVHLHMQMGKERHALETRFGAREKEIKVLSDYCPSGIMRATGGGKIVYCNNAYLEPSGMTMDELLQDRTVWERRIHPDDARKLEQAWHRILNGDQVTTNLEWKWRTGRIMSGSFTRLDLVDPGLSGILACVTDITEQKERLEEAERRRKDAEESKRQQELLVDLTSHEIRTPVSAILQCSSLVKQNLTQLQANLSSADGGFHPTPELLNEIEQDLEALESIYQCGLVQERIAGDVLSLARIQLNMLSLYDVDMSIRNEARKVLGVFSSEAKSKQLSLSLEFGDTLDRMGVTAVKTDPVRLGQIVTNLISNAIRFTDMAATRRISVRYDVAWTPPDKGCRVPTGPAATEPREAADDAVVYLYVSVSDTGAGMARHELELLFRRFHQGNKMIHTRYGGSGLGLFICKRITELLGGDIDVESVQGEGSTFRFYIKTRVAQRRPRPPAATDGDATPPGEPLHVLIVEDNIINQTVLKRQILKSGLTCEVASNGQEALNMIHSSQVYDVVLMDLEMPVMDGLTTIKHIRAAEARGELARQLVIALTGNARQEQIDEARVAGMDDVVIKPYKLPALIATMRAGVAARER